MRCGSIGLGSLMFKILTEKRFRSWLGSSAPLKEVYIDGVVLLTEQEEATFSSTIGSLGDAGRALSQLEGIRIYCTMKATVSDLCQSFRLE